MFLTKSSSARHSLLLLLLAFCCLSSAFAAKITKKVEKTSEKPELEPAASPIEQENDEDAGEDDDDDDDDDDEEDAEEPAVNAADKEAAAAASSNKNPNAVQAATDPTDLSVWGMVRTLWGWLRSDLGESLFGDDDTDDGKPSSGSSAVEGRTFGKIRRLQMALIPIIFKFGVLSAMVAFLVAIGMKSLFLLKVLVAMNAIAILGKFLTLKSSLFGQYENTAPSFNYPGWNPHAKESWGSTGLSGHGVGQPPSKEIHLHIHGNAQTQAQLAGQGYQYESQSGGWASRSDPYGAYAPTGQFTDSQPVGAVAGEVPNNTDPMSLLPTKYRARHLIR
ncbi:uncharacterized protein LOC6546041 [Drosophila erecta]|uniref:Uncharacterized protein n=1 Tax=Drosophila erecta TaxID=7220 RepID=B3NBT8_DROER|nr:uncharacterized protein LOC6546041 [Drosophila erecta]EDV50755.1 uncharacterized protein Dere_GG15119 [Drosophila erecta]